MWVGESEWGQKFCGIRFKIVMDYMRMSENRVRRLAPMCVENSPAIH